MLASVLRRAAPLCDGSAANTCAGRDVARLIPPRSADREGIRSAMQPTAAPFHFLAVPLALAACSAPPPADVGMPELRAELLARKARDQEVRPLHLADLPEATRRELSDRAAVVDADNTARMQAIVEQYGWPTTAMVGKDGADAAWLLVQHADREPAFQERCLPLVQAAADRGEIPKQGMAYLTDRVLRSNGRPQVYGTQYDSVKDEAGKLVRDAQGRIQYLPPRVIDPEHLDERRRSVGLGPWVEYEAAMAKIQQRAQTFAAPRPADDGR